MDIISSVISALLFVAFVPGVLVRIPPNGSRVVVLIVHALMFSLTTSVVMHVYWHKLRHFLESFGNYGPTCPNGYVVGTNQGGQPDCVPIGHATFDPSTGFNTNSQPSK